MSYSQLQNSNKSPDGNKRTVMELFRNIKLNFQDQQKERDENVEASHVQGLPRRYKKPIFTVNDMENTFITLDKSLLYVGDNSTFHKRITLILAIQWISFSFMVNSMAYFFRSPNFSCRVPYTDIFYSCTQSIACKLGSADFKVIPGGSQSITEQFGLYCDYSSNIYSTEGLFFLGGFLSGYILSYISERIGRRPVIMGVLFLSIISMLVCAFAPTFQIFRISFFFAGSFLFGYETEVYIYISQISAIRFKIISINMLTLVWAGTPTFLPLLGFIPSWRYCFVLFAILWAISLPFAYFCFLQSPRFLLSKKCYSQVRQILRTISETNRRPPYRFKLAEQMDNQNQTYMKPKQYEKVQEMQGRLKKSYNYLDLFRYKSIKRATLVLMYLWIFRFFIYFLINLALQLVLTSGFWLTLAIAVSSFSQMIGTFGILIIKFLFNINYTSLQIVKKCLLYLSLLCVLLWFPNIQQDCYDFQFGSAPCVSILAMILLVSLVKFTNSILFSVLITYSSQSFPTVVRSLGYGFTLNFGRISTFMVPFFINFMKNRYQHRNTLCFLAPFGIIGLYFCSLMPRQDSVADRLMEEEQQQKMAKSKEIQMSVIRNHPSHLQHSVSVDTELLKNRQQIKF